MDEERNLDEGTTTDASFEEFLGEIDGELPPAKTEETPKEAKEEEEAIAEDSQQEEAEDEQESEDGTQEEEESEAEASEEEEETTESEEEEEGDDLDDDLDDDDHDVDPRDAKIAELEAAVAELKKAHKPEKEEKEEPLPALPEDLQQQILGDYDIDDITSDPKLFTEVLQRAITVGRDATFEHVMKRLPKMVIQQTQGYQDLMKVRRQFYKNNKDLRPFQNAVATAANEVHSENPDWDMEKVLKEAAKRTRSAIGIQKKNIKKGSKTQKKGKKQKPAFANTPKTKKVKQEVSKLQKDIAETLDL